MEDVFRSRVDWISRGMIIVVFGATLIAPLYLIVFEGKKDPDMIFVIALTLLISTLVTLILLKTSYQFGEKTLVCRSWFIKKQIRYDLIMKAERAPMFYAGLKMASAQKGLIITYGNHKEIYISPEREEEFIAALLERNPAITVRSDLN